MSREYNLYLSDILEAIGRIERYTRGMGYEEFLVNDLVQDGRIRNLDDHRRGRLITLCRGFVPDTGLLRRHRPPHQMVALVEQMLVLKAPRGEAPA